MLDTDIHDIIELFLRWLMGTGEHCNQKGLFPKMLYATWVIADGSVHGTR
jgi:hypothetical protein